ncbi:MAG: hypothetical protein KME42_14120 [Tildeniella nuda ZEHNDER 1965/U140]|nr:hypothetical protein [Tildeniella nuda ZEHNDER 1965/U140]
MPQLDTVLTYEGRAIEIFSKPYYEPSSTIEKVYRYQVEGLPEGFWLSSVETAIAAAKSAIDEYIAYTGHTQARSMLYSKQMRQWD